MIKDLVQDGIAARASFQTWFVLRQEAFPVYESRGQHRKELTVIRTSTSKHSLWIIIKQIK